MVSEELANMDPLHQVKTRMYGPFRAEVAYNLDPLHQGRVKARVPALHSTDVSIEDADLPWAVPMMLEGGAHDVGRIVVPVVGSTVWVLFEQGDPQAPLYLGGWLKNPTEEREMTTSTSAVTGRQIPTRPVSGGTWMQPAGPETPQEALADPYFDPTTTVLHKTRTGHAVYFRDRDGFEELVVVDRSGQIVRMSSPLTDDEDTGNDQQRGLRSVAGGDPVPASALAGDVATVEVLGRSGQGLRVVSRQGSDWVELSSQDDGHPGVGDRISVLAGAGLGVFEVVGTSSGKETARLRIDVSCGTVEVVGQGQVLLHGQSLVLQADSIALAGDVSVTGDLRVSGDLSVSGRDLS